MVYLTREGGGAAGAFFSCNFFGLAKRAKEMSGLQGRIQDFGKGGGGSG